VLYVGLISGSTHVEHTSDHHTHLFDRICDPESNIWRMKVAEKEVCAVIITVIEKELEPLAELETFCGVNLWTFQKKDNDDDDVEEDISDSASVNTVASKGKGGKGGRKRGSMIQAAIRSFTQCVKKIVSEPPVQSSPVLASPDIIWLTKSPHTQPDVMGMLQVHLHMDFSKVQKKHILSCANGVIDFKSSKFTPGLPKPEDFITQFCPIEYDPNVSMQPAIDFFNELFPEEEYPDRIEMIQFMQLYIGYGLTLETKAQIALIIYGKGSNCKSILMKALLELLGSMLCRTIPVESLSKARTANNDSLAGVRDTRLVLISESNGSAKIDIATFNAIVCGEETTTKGMYDKEFNFIPVMKLVLFLNTLPQWGEANGGKTPYCIQRRLAYMCLKKQFLDKESPADKIIIQQLESNEKVHLIGVRDNSYYETKVAPHFKSFLFFAVQGACKFHANNEKISIPKSMKQEAKNQAFDKSEAIEDFASQMLVPFVGRDLPFHDIYNAFLKMFEGSIDRSSYDKDNDFGKGLKAWVAQAKVDRADEGWGMVKKKRKKQSGSLTTVYENVMFDASPGVGGQ
jgi:P4 family phage/plasmid primase-like protien